MKRNSLFYVIIALLVVLVGVSYTGYTNYNNAKRYKSLSDSITNVYNREKEISETYRKVDSILWIDYRKQLYSIEPSRLDSTVKLYDHLNYLYTK